MRLARMKNPAFGIWDEDAEWGPSEREAPLVEGRTYVLPYRERVKYLPRYDVVAGCHGPYA